MNDVILITVDTIIAQLMCIFVTLVGYVDIAEGDEKGLEAAVATLGPVAAAMDAGRPTFQFYSDGIYFDPECGNRADDVNHAVLVVGYGTEPSGQKYWLVKNSYGPQWGIGGYVKIAKDANNHCGIATQASYPLV
jgi:cathepsin L